MDESAAKGWEKQIEEADKNKTLQAENKAQAAVIEQAKEALKGDDMDTMTSARDELMQAFSAAGQEMYQSQAVETEDETGEATEGEEGADAAEEGGAEGEESVADEDVVEADYEIVEEET